MHTAYLRLVIAALGFGTFAAPWLAAQAATPTTIQRVIEICSPVIGQEYSGDSYRWGQCVRATEDFINFVPGSPLAANRDRVSADLVFELAKLYQSKPEICARYETELPQAIDLAAKFTIDHEQKRLMHSVSAAIAQCERFETGSIVVLGRGVSDS